MTIPTQKTISKGSTANDGTGDSLRDAADKINDNFYELWQSNYNSSDQWPARSFVVGSVDNNSPAAPAPGQFNASAGAQPTNTMFNFTNFRISQSDQLGEKRTTTPQMNYNAAPTPAGAPPEYDSVNYSTTLTMYKRQDSNGVARSNKSLSSYKIVAIYTGNVFYKTISIPVPADGVPPSAGGGAGRFGAAYEFKPHDSDYWYFEISSAPDIYGDSALSAGDSCFIKIENLW